jgi:hypothetical protein
MRRGGIAMEDGESNIMTGNRSKIKAAFFAFVLVSAVFLGVVSNVSGAQFFFDDMDPPMPSWTSTGMWNITTARAWSPTQSWVYNDGVDYDDGGTNSGELTSPVIDLTTVPLANLTFWTWYETEGGMSYDQMWVQISENAGPFVNEYQINPSSMNMWLPISLNITSHVGNNIQVRFFFDTVDSIANNFEGWYIDDVEVNDIPLPPTSAFAPPHEDSGLDTDSDTLYNYLIVNVTVDIIVAGWYNIYAELYDPFLSYITDVTNYTFLNAGLQTVQLQFEGYLIYLNGVDGVFNVNLELLDDFWVLLDTDSHATNLYNFVEFDPPPAVLEPPHSDYGEDTDFDFLFDFLVINVTVNISVAGTYEVTGDLSDPLFNWIGFASNMTFLNVGVQVVQLRFDSGPIFTNGENGIYSIDIDLWDDMGNWLDYNFHSTGIYNYFQFDPPPAFFEPPYSDYGEDTDSDTYYNFLVVNVTVNITVAGTYNIFGDLFDPIFNWLDDDLNTTFLPIGVHVVQLRFDGGIIYNNGENGVFDVDLNLYDDLFTWLDSDTYSTNSYNYFQFQPPAGRFEPPHSDYGEDTEPDSYYNFLVVNVTVNITVAGTYQIDGDLLDPFFNWIDFASNTTFLNIGVQVVQLRFDGSLIYNNGENGVFNVDLTLFDDLFNWLDNDMHSTIFYNFIEFQPPPAWFEPPHSDFGEDTDSNFLYNYLVINVMVNVSVAGTYEITGDLIDPLFNFLESVSNSTFLNVGLQVVQLRFNGLGIYSNGENGTYTVFLDLYDDLGNWMESDTHTTAFYNYDEFDMPSATIEPPHSDYGEDTDSNFLFNFLVINVTVNITTPGTYEVSGPLFDPFFNFVGFATNITFLNAGLQVVQLRFSGAAIYNNGENGTFTVMLELYDDLSNLLDNDMYTTNFYNYDEFDLPTATLQPPYSDYGEDTDFDTYFNFMVVNVTVNVLTAGTYTVYGRLNDPLFNFIDDDMNTTFLNVGIQVVQIRFMGTDIYNNSESGSFEVELYLADGLMNLIDQDLYYTSIYNFDEFQPPSGNPWATASGPVSPLTNNPNPTITYTYGNGPTSVEIYWSDDGGSTWNLWGTDASVDGSWPAGSALPASGSYEWNVRAIGTPSEAAPSGSGDVEAGSYDLDIDAPTVQSTTPTNAQTGVALDQDIIITFNESMSPGSVDGTVEPNPGGIIPGFSGGDTVLTLTHNDFAPNTRYWVNITLGTDVAGNNLDPLPYSFYFDTGAPADSATATAPTGGPTNVVGIDILYGTTGSPPTVDLYYTTDLLAPFTWNLIGTDNPADGSYLWTVPADGSYGWFAVSPSELAPTSSDAPEASFYVYDGTAPNVDNTVPVDMSVGVAINQDVIITFNETMIPGSVAYTIEPNPGGLTPGWGAGDTVITITHTDFAQGTRYWVNISAGTDLATNDLNPLPYSFYFDTVVGTTATASGPISTPTNVAGITITYLTTGSPPTADIYYTTDTSSPYTWNLIGTDNPADGSYPWVVPSDGDYGWVAVSPDESAPLTTDAPEASFYIYDGTQPQVSSTDPLDLAIGVSINQVVIINFDEIMTTASATYTIEPNPGGLSGLWSGGDTILTISHTDFLTSTTYWVNITAGTDLAGNNLNPIPYSFSFDTAATAAIATGPISGPTNVAGITVTYNTVGAPLSVDLWYTTDTSAPYSWINLGTDAPADGSFGWTVPADGDYGWFAQSPDESAPTTSDAPEASFYVYDGTAPGVFSTNPLDMAISVAVTQVVVITFDEAMIPGSVTYTIEPNPGGLTPVWSVGDTILTISHTDFGPGTRYWVNITAGTDLAGNNLNPLPYSFYFDTVTTATALGPISALTNVAGITITYGMVGTPATVDLYYTTDTGTPYTWTLVGTDNPADGSYGWTVPADGSYGWFAVSPDESAPLTTDAPEASFYVYDGTPPEVSLTNPLDMAVGILVTELVVITFNETMVPGSVTYTIEPNPGGLSPGWSAGDTILTISHTDFAPGTRYWVNITAGTDLAGNNLNPLPYSFYFDTEVPDLIPPIATLWTPTGTTVLINSDIVITFNESMNTASVEAAFSYTDGSTTWTISDGAVNWNPGNTIMTFNPATDFDYSTVYTVTINGSIAEDMNGNTLDGNGNGTSEGWPDDDLSWQFTTENMVIPDTTPPLSSVTNLPEFSTSLTFDLSYTASDSESGVKEVELWYRKDGGGWSLYNTYSGGSRTVSFTADSDGDYSFYTRARDNDNNYESAPSSEDTSTIVDSTAPTIILVDISDTSPINAGSVTFTVTFSEDMDTGVDPAVTFGLSLPYDTYNLIKSSFSQDTWTGTFIVATSTGDGQYTLKISLAEDMAGNQIVDYTMQFTIDTIRPGVSSGGPTGSSVPITTPITIAFNETMNKTTVQNAFSFTDGTTTWTVANGSVSWSANTMTFTPDNDLLEYGTEYTVTMGTGAKDPADNSISEAYTWSFTTLTQPDTTAPTVSTVSHTGDDVEVSNTLTITFSEPMNHTKVEEAITISGGVTIQGFSWVGNRLTITFTSELEPDTQYTATIGKGAEDEAGNELDDPYTWTFTTKEEKEEPTEGSFLWIIILIIVIVVVLLLVLMMKKKKPEESPIDEYGTYPEEDQMGSDNLPEDENIQEDQGTPLEEHHDESLPEEPEAELTGEETPDTETGDADLEKAD